MRLLGLLALTMVWSCGKEAVDQKQKNTNPTTTDDKVENIQTANSAMQALIQVKQGKLSQEEGLGIAGDFLKNKDENSDQELLELATIMAGFDGSVNFHLKHLIGIKTSYIDGQLQNIDSLNALFSELSNYVDESSDNIDRLMLVYLDLRIKELQATEDVLGNKDEIINYFNTKVMYSLDEGTEINSLFNKYNRLDAIIPGALSEIFGEQTDKIIISKKSPVLTQKAYAKLVLKEARKTRTENLDSKALAVFESAKNNALWAINSSQNEDISVKEALEIVSGYFLLFERPLNEVQNKKTWIKLLDERTMDVARELYSFVSKLIQKHEVKELKTLSIHPYVKLYINKAQLNKDGKVWFYENEMRTSFEQVTAEFVKDLKNYKELENSFKLDHEKYLLSFYQLELKKHYLENRAREIGQVADSVDERNEVYNSLLGSLLNGLNYRFDKNVTIDQIRTQGMQNELFKQFADEYYNAENASMKLNYCEHYTNNCPEKVLKPGIYVAPSYDLARNNIELYGESIVFHPMALVYAPSRNVNLNFKKIENAWIDVSGFNGVQKGKDPNTLQSIKLPQLKNSTSGKKNRDGTYKNTWAVSGKITSLKKQPKSGNGTNAGKIVINQNHQGEFIGLPLLVARGGDGASGVQGLSAKTNKTITAKVVHNKVNTYNFGSCINSISYTEYYLVEKYEWVTRRRGRDDYTSGMERTGRSLTTPTVTKYINRGRGGEGGNAGNGHEVKVLSANSHEFDHLLLNNIVSPGNVGLGGDAGDCGHGNKSSFTGKTGAEGKVVND